MAGGRDAASTVCYRDFGTYSILNKRKLIAIVNDFDFLYKLMFREFYSHHIQFMFLRHIPRVLQQLFSFVFAVPNFVIHTVLMSACLLTLFIPDKNYFRHYKECYRSCPDECTKKTYTMSQYSEKIGNKRLYAYLKTYHEEWKNKSFEQISYLIRSVFYSANE